MEALKKVKPIWFGVAGVAAIGIGYGIYYLWFRDKSGITFSDRLNQISSGGKRNDTSYPIRQGRIGEYVKPLQRHLNKLIKPPLVSLKVDGNFGPKTHNAAIRYLGKAEFSKSDMEQLTAPLPSPFKTR